jgi:hypothetical protein
MRRLRYLLTCLAILAGLLTTAPPASAAVDPLSCPHGSTVVNWGAGTGAQSLTYYLPGRYALTNFCLRDHPNSRRIIWQWNGDLVIRPGEYGGPGAAIWHSNTAGRGSKLIFHRDGTIYVDAALFNDHLSTLGRAMTAPPYSWTMTTARTNHDSQTDWMLLERNHGGSAFGYVYQVTSP